MAEANLTIPVDVEKLVADLVRGHLEQIRAALLLDLGGVAVHHAQPGQRLIFVVQQHLSLAQADHMRAMLQRGLPGVEVVIADGVHQVVVADRTDDSADTATSTAREAASQ